MKNIIVFVFGIILLGACSKDADFLASNPDLGAELSFANLRVGAIVAGSHITTTGSPCEPVGIPNTEIGLFYERDADMNTNLTLGDYYYISGTGSALFYKIKPGSYTIIAKNNLGHIKLINDVQVGESEIVIQF